MGDSREDIVPVLFSPQGTIIRSTHAVRNIAHFLMMRLLQPIVAKSKHMHEEMNPQ